MCIYIVLERWAIIRDGEQITGMNYRTQVIIPVLAVWAGDCMGEKTVFMPRYSSAQKYVASA